MNETRRHIVIFDTEYTTWDGTHARCWTGTTPHGTPEYKELVQIGAIKVDWPSGHIIDEFNQLIKPAINPVLSDYFIKLTGITQNDIDTKGDPFPIALENFMTFIGDDGPLYSYGNDIAIIGENIALNRCNARKLYGGNNCGAMSIDYFIGEFDPASKVLNSGKLAAHFNALDKMPAGAEHNALYDCYSILAALLHIREQGGFLPIV